MGTGFSVTNRGFKRNLTKTTGRYDKILVHLYVLLNRASITEPFSATCDYPLDFRIFLYFKFDNESFQLNAAAEVLVTASDSSDEEDDYVENAQPRSNSPKAEAPKRHSIHVDNPEEQRIQRSQQFLGYSATTSRARGRRASETSLLEVRFIASFLSFVLSFGHGYFKYISRLVFYLDSITLCRKV